MSNKEFLKEFPLEYSLPTEEKEAIKVIIKQVQENHAVDFSIEKSHYVSKEHGQYYDIKIWCLTANFAKAYAAFGMLYQLHVLPIWQARYKK